MGELPLKHVKSQVKGETMMPMIVHALLGNMYSSWLGTLSKAEILVWKFLAMTSLGMCDNQSVSCTVVGVSPSEIQASTS